MHAYRLTDDEAFGMFQFFATAQVLALCECKEPAGCKCEWCNRVDAACEANDWLWEEWIDRKVKAVARRMARRRRVTLPK